MTMAVKHLHDECNQRIDKNGRIHVSHRAWVLRFVIVSGLFCVIVFNLYQGLMLEDPLVAYSTIMPLHAFLVILVGWFFYKNPAKGKAGNELVSVIVPVYNQQSMIEIVIDAIYDSDYKNLEVIAINDGSKDKTREILDSLAKKYSTLRVFHKPNGGKRKAVAEGFKESKGKFVVLIDSDSVVDKHAISEFMKTFNSDPKIGSVVGYAKVWNANKNILTKCQDVWYDYAFNIHKTTESKMGNVMCCSGCLAGYRREAIEHFVPYWVQAKVQNSDDRDLTSYVIATPWAKKEIAPFSKKLLESGAQYDDAEDRILTANTILNWKSVYVASSIVYTDVPENMRSYLRQQTRWKKGYIRSNFFVSTFFWRKNPIISSIFYTEFMTTFTAPFIALIVLVYEPLVLNNFWIPVFFIGGSLLAGLAHGIDYKFRDAKSKNWKYKPIMNLFASFGLSWLVFPALLTLRKNQWLTR